MLARTGWGLMELVLCLLLRLCVRESVCVSKCV